MDFENEITKKNQTNKEIGLIINSINNIYTICSRIKTDQKKQVSKELDKDNLEDKALIENLIKKLKDSVTIVGDLTKLLQKLPEKCTKEWYEEESVKNEHDLMMGQHMIESAGAPRYSKMPMDHARMVNRSNATKKNINQSVGLSS